MKTYPHKKFLEENKVQVDDLPKMLRRRILAFETLQDDLEHTIDEDKDDLLKKLSALSDELDEDLEEFYEDHLENNEPPFDGTISVNYVHTPSDEEILEEIFKGRIKDLSPEFLREKGLKTKLKNEVIIGKFRLYRPRFQNSYLLVVKQDH